MPLFKQLQVRWQYLTGDEETPLDGDTPAWIVSLVIHLLALFLLSDYLRTAPAPPNDPVVMVQTPIEEPEEELEELPKEFFFSNEEQEEVGAGSVLGDTMAESLAAVTEESEFSELEIEPNLTDLVSDDLPQIFTEPTDATSALETHDYIASQGRAGVGTTGVKGAIDRITQEILDSLNRHKTLVVWLFDRSVSLSAQRAGITKRMDRIYHELGVIEASQHAAFANHHDKPLLTSVAAFGSQLEVLTPQPTDDISEIKSAISSISNDASGVENVFSSVNRLAKRYRTYAKNRDRRNVMFVIFTDESGDDSATMLDPAVKICRALSMPVYVVGIPAPFGRKQVEVKWVDPDPQFDQTPQWTMVTQGPESFVPERVKIAFSARKRREESLDSGFGPFALTRLAVATGGIYFAVHPNRDPTRNVSRAETAHLSAYLKRFFDPDVMRRYRPDYVSAKEYRRLLGKNKAKLALVRAAERSWIEPLDEPRLRFPKRSEAELSRILTEAQKQAAKLSPKVDLIYRDLKEGEQDRGKIDRPRWQAGYDLAMGRVLAAKVRTHGYNVMLAKAKGGMKFQEAGNDTWILRPSKNVHAGSVLEKAAEKATFYLSRVIDEHPNTPWALLARQELRDPMGWEWTERQTLAPREPRTRRPGNNNNPPPPRDDERRNIPKKQRRDPPKI